MKTNYLQVLENLVANTTRVERPTPRDWEAAESDLGVKFPLDFTALVSALGTGWLGAGLYFRNPRASARHLCLSRPSLLDYREMVADSQHRSNVHLFPQTRGLIHIGGIDRQHFLLESDPPDASAKHLVWWDLDYHKVNDLGVSLLRFVHDLYFNRIHQRWAKNLRNCVWGDPSEAFFTAWRDPFRAPPA